MGTELVDLLTLPEVELVLMKLKKKDSSYLLPNVRENCEGTWYSDQLRRIEVVCCTTGLSWQEHVRREGRKGAYSRQYEPCGCLGFGHSPKLDLEVWLMDARGLGLPTDQEYILHDALWYGGRQGFMVTLLEASRSLTVNLGDTIIQVKEMTC